MQIFRDFVRENELNVVAVVPFVCFALARLCATLQDWGGMQTAPFTDQAEINVRVRFAVVCPPL